MGFVPPQIAEISDERRILVRLLWFRTSAVHYSTLALKTMGGANSNGLAALSTQIDLIKLIDLTKSNKIDEM